MKKIKFGYEENVEYEKTVNKVRAIIINEQGRCLVTKCAGVYVLPGGKIDKGETELEALQREIEEESGIKINVSEVQPYLEIESYDQNYYSRSEKRNINKITNTKFYIAYTDEEINDNNKRLTESEIELKQTIEFENLSRIAYLVETNQTDNEKKSNFDREILTALKEFQIFKENQNKINEDDLYR